MSRGKRVATTLDPEVYARVVADAERRGLSLSAWLSDATTRIVKVEQGLAAVAQYEAEYGEFTEEELQAAQERADESVRWQSAHSS